jgi:aquaporin Z
METLGRIIATCIRYGSLGGMAGATAGCTVGGLVGIFGHDPLGQVMADAVTVGGLTVAGPAAVLGACDAWHDEPWLLWEPDALSWPAPGTAMKKLAAELFGTFALVFAGTGAITINGVSGGVVSHVGIALTFGLVVLAMIYAVGDVSGAHLNPAVTAGFFLSRRFPGRWVLPYVAAQTVGALVASLLVHALFPDHPTLGATLPAGPSGQSFLLEGVLTLLLMFVILSVSTGAKEKGPLAGVAVGSVIAFEALFAGPISGASMNPARSLAPALVSGHLEHLWVYLVAPLLGACLAVPACCCVHEEPCCRPAPKKGGLPMTEPVIAHPPRRLLFVCVENSNRSQMAEAFARIHGGDCVEAYSAGSRPSGRVNPKAVEVMGERAYDLTTHRSKSLAEVPQVEYDAVVGMGCGDDGCPLVKAKRREEWDVPDPKALPPEEFRAVADLIEQKVKALLAQMG